MIPRHWFVAGWILIAATAGLASAGAVLALDAVSGHYVQLYTASPGTTFTASLDPSQLLLGVVLAVLAGVAFFGGLACFFWGAMLDSRQRMAQILQPVHRGE